MTSKQANWIRSKECHNVFDTIKKLVSRENLLSYPNFNEFFVIYMDSNKLQLGPVISQDDNTIAFYSRKVNSASS